VIDRGLIAGTDNSIATCWTRLVKAAKKLEKHCKRLALHKPTHLLAKKLADANASRKAQHRHSDETATAGPEAMSRRADNLSSA
jgi:hypothetical protein